MSLRELRDNWDEVAVSDPWRAILGRPGEGSPRGVEEFFLSGVWEINEVVGYAKELGLPRQTHSALDFGCGAGRLTQALAAHFETVTGVDISPAMIDLAERHNKHPDRCHYLLNESRDLGVLPDRSFDLVYSNITLQHLRPPLVEAYLREFLRVLSGDGLLLFHLPSHRQAPALARLLPGNLYSHCARLLWPITHRGQPMLEMYGMRQEKAVAFLERHGGRVLEAREKGSAGEDWVSYRYAVMRSP